MKIELKEIPVKELSNGYKDNNENGDFSFNGLAFQNLPKDKQEQILNYKLTVYLCGGTDSEKLE